MWAPVTGGGIRSGRSTPRGGGSDASGLTPRGVQNDGMALARALDAVKGDARKLAETLAGAKRDARRQALVKCNVSVKEFAAACGVMKRWFNHPAFSLYERIWGLGFGVWGLGGSIVSPD